MSWKCPRVLISGVHSGVGKTSLALALAGALRRRGYRVQTFKVGPDFLDPTYLSLASGRPCYNLDGWMSSREYVQGLFVRAAQGADISVVEGVMGMFDGADPATSEGSTAEIARWLGTPILLAVDARGMARSLAAVVKGYADFESGLKISGVIANRCGLAKHVEWLAQSLETSSLPPLIAGVPIGALPRLPSRHLGLVTADSQNLSPNLIEQLALTLEKYASVDEIVRIAREALPLSPPSPCPLPPVDKTRPRGERAGTSKSKKKFPPPGGGRGRVGEKHDHSPRVRLGIAYDSAFHFYYRDLLDELEAGGGELIHFSPIRDPRLPEGLHALYFGGGYPEEHADALAANEKMLMDIRQFADSSRPIYAECGGLMYLGQKIETLDGRGHSLVGLLPAASRMLDRRKALGYVEITLRDDSLWGRRGKILRGHEFHYSELASEVAGQEGWRAVYSLRRKDIESARSEGFQRGRILASYAHLHLASHPEAIQRFLSLCAHPSFSPEEAVSQGGRRGAGRGSTLSEP